MLEMRTVSFNPIARVVCAKALFRNVLRQFANSAKTMAQSLHNAQMRMPNGAALDEFANGIRETNKKQVEATVHWEGQEL